MLVAAANGEVGAWPLKSGEVGSVNLWAELVGERGLPNLRVEARRDCRVAWLELVLSCRGDSGVWHDDCVTTKGTNILGWPWEDFSTRVL